MADVKVTREIYGYQVHGQPTYVSCQTLPQVKRYVRGIGEREFALHEPGSPQRAGRIRTITV